MSTPSVTARTTAARVRGAAARFGLGWLAALIALGVVVILTVAVYLYDHARRDVIAQGVSVGGVPVGGLHEAAARKKLQRVLIARLDQPVTVRAGSRSWSLSPREAAVTVNVASLASRAVKVSREGSILTRTFRGVFGGSLNRDIPVEVAYAHQAIRNLTAQVRAGVNREVRNAYVQPTATGLEKVHSHSGIAVESGRLGGRIEHALSATGSLRTVQVPTHKIKPTVTVAQLASKYPAYIIIDRNAFRLRLYEHLKLADTYEIAVGMQGLETEPGMYKIQWKQVNPPWYVPNKAWAGSLAGTVVPPGPADPLKARFMSFNGGAGIHGIDPSEYGTIGHTASHGCVRMRIPDVIALYSRTPVGTPVFVA